MPPALVTSSTQSWMPSVCFFEATFCAPVCDALKPMISFLDTAAVAAPEVPGVADVVGVAAPQDMTMSPSAASATALARMRCMGVLLLSDLTGSGERADTLWLRRLD